MRKFCLLFMVACLLASGAIAAEISFLEYRGARDHGPQDGIFDAFLTPPNVEMIYNNGFGHSRGTMEFDLSEIPDGRLDSATLTLRIYVYEGPRSFAVHSYKGDGTVTLDDFALDGLVETRMLDLTGLLTLTFDVTDFVGTLLSGGDTIAGFNLREEPANEPNYSPMRVRLEPQVLAPILIVEISPRVPAVPIAELVILSLLLLVSGAVLLRFQREAGF